MLDVGYELCMFVFEDVVDVIMDEVVVVMLM